MHLEILTPDETLYTGDVKLVQLPGTSGSFELLDNHAPLISTLKEGQVKVINNNNEKLFFDIKGGVLEVLNNNVILLAQ
jgi:F-type H+-transporting ATPase subunit epsilon